MAKGKSKRVVGKGNLQGTLINESKDAKSDKRHIQLDDGTEIIVPADLLTQQADGSYYLPMSLAELNREGEEGDRQAHESIIIDVVKEELDVQKREITTGIVNVSKVVHEHEETVDEPLLYEEVKVERKPINRPVEHASPVRQEGNVIIVPIYEEVLVVEKRLVLKEELHITIQKHAEHQPQTHTLRSEEVIVTRRKPEQ